MSISCFGLAFALGGCGAAPEELSTEEANQELVAACTVSYSINSWPAKDGKPPGLSASLTITNNSAAINGWALKWNFASGERLVNAWNASVTQNGSAASARNAAWNGAIPKGGKATFGYQATLGSSPPRKPTNFVLNGKSCELR
ncbi:MAG TPA: cellulose binding domain-containing protein [Polyangiaceae bacterium]|nr:cellulose binding domain-containing protein [Polyangiaceae bacterium]